VAAFLEGEAGRAPTPESRAVYDRTGSWRNIELGPQTIESKALPMLAQSAHDPPTTTTPTRAWARYYELKRYDDALREIDLALARVYGPRKIEILSLKADVLLAKKDKPARRAALHEALDVAKAAQSESLREAARGAGEAVGKNRKERLTKWRALSVILLGMVVSGCAYRTATVHAPAVAPEGLQVEEVTVTQAGKPHPPALSLIFAPRTESLVKKAAPAHGAFGAARMKVQVDLGDERDYFVFLCQSMGDLRVAGAPVAW